MDRMFLEQGRDGQWRRHLQTEDRRHLEEPCDPLGELIALVETDLSFLVSDVKELSAEVEPLLLSPRRVEAARFFAFRKGVLEVCARIKTKNALLGRLAEAYLEDCRQFYLEEEAFATLYLPEGGRPEEPNRSARDGTAADDSEDEEDEEYGPDEEDYFNAFDLLEAMRRGAMLPGRVLHTQLLAEMFLDLHGNQDWLPVPTSPHAFIKQELFRPFFGENQSADGIHRSYEFDDPRSYYALMAVLADDRAHPLARCECCGRFFAPASKNNTKYCDRVQPNGRTCRELGPALRHRTEAAKDPVLETFYRVKRRMYKRMERSLDGMCAPSKALDLESYFAWLEAAEANRAQYRAGKITKEEALHRLDPEEPSQQA